MYKTGFWSGRAALYFSAMRRCTVLFLLPIAAFCSPAAGASNGVGSTQGLKITGQRSNPALPMARTRFSDQAFIKNPTEFLKQQRPIPVRMPALARQKKAEAARKQAEAFAKAGQSITSASPGGTQQLTPAVATSSSDAPSAGPIKRAQVAGVIFDGPTENDAPVSGIPPDTIMAAGPGHVVMTINSLMAIYDKMGNRLGGYILLDTKHFFSGLGLNPTTFCFDPRVIYDQEKHHWIVTIDSFDDTPGSEDSNVLIAVSEDDDPTGNWITYAFQVLGHDDQMNPTFADYPTLAVNASVTTPSEGAIYISVGMYTFASEGFVETDLYSLGIDELYSGAPTQVVNAFGPGTGGVIDENGDPVFVIQPAMTYHFCPETYLVASSFADTFLTVMTLSTDSTIPPTLSTRNLPVNDYSFPPPATQKGTSQVVETNDVRLINAVWRDNNLWCAHNSADNTGQNCFVHWYQLLAPANIGGLANTSVAQQGQVTGPKNSNAYFPAISSRGIDETAIMTFTISSDKYYPSAAMTGKFIGDAPNTMYPAAIYKKGEAPYEDFALRWGDYAGAAADPDGMSVWVASEYAKSPNPNFGNAIAQIFMPGKIADFGDLIVVQDDEFTSGNIQPPGSFEGWSILGQNIPGFSYGSYNDADSVFESTVTSIPLTESRFRVTGWVSNRHEWMPYYRMGSDNFARAKYYVYASDNGDPSLQTTTTPNLRVRLSNRFALSAILEVFNHQNADPGNTSFALELRPSIDPGNPSMYRVDYDPIDVPYLTQNAEHEGIQRAIEAYTLDPQDTGTISMLESVIGYYPISAFAQDTSDTLRIFKTSASDAGDLKVYNSATELQIVNLIPGTNSGDFATVSTDPPLGTYSESPAGITFDTTNVPSDRIGLITREIHPAPDLSPALYPRVSEGKQYKIRFHITSTQDTNKQAQVRLRARTIKFAWTQKLEIGGAWGTGGTGPATGNNAIAQQVVPGVGCMNPDIDPGDVNGGWYTILFNSPMSRAIRADFGLSDRALFITMPNISVEPGPNQNSPSRRDIRLGVDLIDTISGGLNAPLEQGQFTLDRIEMREFPLVDDGS